MSDAQKVAKLRAIHGETLTLGKFEYRECSRTLDEYYENIISQTEIDKTFEEYVSETKSLLIELALPKYRKIFDGTFGTSLIHNTGKDLAGELSRRFFCLNDYYVTPDQLYDRFTKFSYEYDNDILQNNAQLKKTIYNYSNAINLDFFNESNTNIIANENTKNQSKLFLKSDGIRYDDSYLIEKGKKIYRQNKVTSGMEDIDELTGQYLGKNKHQHSNAQIDHVQSLSAATYNSKYMDSVLYLKEAYNSADNFQQISNLMNGSKGDVRVYDTNGNDITYKATPEQYVEAICLRLEKPNKNNKLERLQEQGILDKNGKVKSTIRKDLLRRMTASQNATSVATLKGLNYTQITKDSVNQTKSVFRKIITGQVLYYVLPPVFYEAKNLIKENLSFDTFITKLTAAIKRIHNYVKEKLSAILSNIAINSNSKFLKHFFDILISMMQASIKKVIRILKTIILSLVNCVKILFDQTKSNAQKKDAITKLMSVAFVNLVLEFLFEGFEKVGIPAFLMESMQVLSSILATNAIMLFLERGDFFCTHNMNNKKELSLNINNMITSEWMFLQMEKHLALS